MNEVEFHHGMGDKLAYACRLLRKAYRSGARVVVTADASTLRQLDRQLWVFEELEFVPHVCALGSQPLAERLHDTPVWLTDVPASAPPGRQVLVNLGQAIPDGIESFDRFCEVVSTESDDREQGRQRWRAYKARGWPVKDLKVQGEA
jgi:DNA polymerase III subunit chi